MKKLSILALIAVAGASQAGVYDSGTGFGMAIPDNTPAGVTAPFTVTTLGDGPVSQVELYFNPTHTWIGDLILTMTDAGGNSLNLWNRPGSSGGSVGNSNDVVTVFYADGGVAQGSIPTTPAVNSATSGILYAANGGAMGTLNGNNGSWQMFGSDNAGGDLGTIDRIVIRTTPVPEPGTFIALGLGGVALAAMRRRKK